MLYDGTLTWKLCTWHIYYIGAVTFIALWWRHAVHFILVILYFHVCTTFYFSLLSSLSRLFMGDGGVCVCVCIISDQIFCLWPKTKWYNGFAHGSNLEAYILYSTVMVTIKIKIA